MEYSSTHISSVETGRKMPTLRFSRSADRAFGTGDTADTFERQWREIHHGSLLEGFPEYVGYEGRAVEIRLYEVGVIPGLLQTPEYATVLAESAVKRGAITTDQAAERVSFVAERQAALVRTSPPLVFAVLDESCIRRPIGGPGVMDAQLARLAGFAELPNTVLQIAPFDMGERRPFSLPITVLTLPDRSLMSYAESAQRGHLERESTFVLPMLTAATGRSALPSGVSDYDQPVVKGHLVMTESLSWFKSSYSENGGQCIEAAAKLATVRGIVPVRDSKNPSGPVLDFPIGAFSSFVAGVKSGQIGTI